MEKPIVVYNKHADKEKNRIIIPKVFIDNWGRDYYLEVYKDYIKLVPINKKVK